MEDSPAVPPSPADEHHHASVGTNNIIPEDERKRKMAAGSSLLVASVAIVATSALACQLMGRGVIVHFLVLMCYGAVFLSLGAFLVRPAPPPPPPPPRQTGALGDHHPATAGASAFPLRGDGRPPRSASGTRNTTRGARNGLAVVNREGSSSSVFHSSSATASPLSWVGETVEGSINWLRGNSGVNERRRGRSRAGRRRSKSAGGALLGTERHIDGGESAATSPGGVGGNGGGAATDNNASSPNGFPMGFGRVAAGGALGALPTLGAGIPQGQLARSRVWSRTFGSGGQATSATGREGAGATSNDHGGDESVDTGPDGETGRGGGVGAPGDWLVGASLGDDRCVRERRGGLFERPCVWCVCLFVWCGSWEGRGF